MRYFSLILLLFISIKIYAIEYQLENKKDYGNNAGYYTLSIFEGDKEKHIDITFMGKGNAHWAEISETLTFSCPWGKVEGVRVRSSSFHFDGGKAIDEFFFFDKQLNNFFAKMYIRTLHSETTPILVPVALQHAVCQRTGRGADEDSISGKYTIDDEEVISHGPFLLKGVPDTYVKYVIDDNANINFIYEHEYGENLIDSYGKKNNSVAKIASVFFTPLANQNHIINLVYWLAEDDNRCYQVYAYRYDQQDNFSANPNINNDPNLSGCDKGKQKFNYNTAAAIKAYLKRKYPDS